MFFILAKVLWFLLQPSSLMLAMVIAGATLAFTTWRRLARGLLWGAVAALLICGLSPLGDVLIRPLEQRFPRVELDRPGAPVTGIIVLGGAEDNHAMDTPQLAGLNEAAERYTEAVVLARRLPSASLVFSGGSGAVLTIEPPEAETAGRLFEALGIAKDRITLETKSRDTCENALFRRVCSTRAPNSVGCSSRRPGTCRVPWAAFAAQGSRWRPGRWIIARRAASA